MGQYQKNRNIFFIKFRDWNLKLYNKFVSNPPYLDSDKVFPENKILEENWMVIKDEINSILEKTNSLPKFHDVDDGQEYKLLEYNQIIALLVESVKELKAEIEELKKHK